MPAGRSIAWVPSLSRLAALRPNLSRQRLAAAESFHFTSSRPATERAPESAASRWVALAGTSGEAWWQALSRASVTMAETMRINVLGGKGPRELSPQRGPK
ncbi:hypothetical protein D3C72_755960 [compost metagenome]